MYIYTYIYIYIYIYIYGTPARCDPQTCEKRPDVNGKRRVEETQALFKVELHGAAEYAHVNHANERHVTHMNEAACHACEGGKLLTWMSAFARVDEAK